MALPERQLIARLRSKVRGKNAILGIGDDCAILRVPTGHEALVTTDFSLEGVHFRREWRSPECIGHRCLARGLSDIAAMGGRPMAAFLSLALPKNVPQRWVDRFFSGLLRLAEKFKVELAGGDTSQSPVGVLADITVVGSVPRGTALRRSGARVGDQIYVTGALGESAAALQLLTQEKIKRRDVFPEPRIAIGDWLVKKGVAGACIDASDGLSTDLAHICEESVVGAVVGAAAIPVHPSAGKLHNALDLALHGGEDYELLFTAAKKARVPAQVADVQITRIGEITSGSTVRLSQNGRTVALSPAGWEHFRRKPEERTRRSRR
ncbi:MAG TPA: thiamine-phosphate kinase [Terriglobales bacterium]|nr:thiamine-phosphate kinase [Terriglobales bacterium]